MNLNKELYIPSELELSELNRATLEYIPWTKFYPDNRIAITIEDKAIIPWTNLLSNNYEFVDLNTIVRNKTREFIELCIFDLYLQSKLQNQHYDLHLASWSDDVLHKVDAILDYNNQTYHIDFTRNTYTYRQKINDNRISNRCNWVVYYSKLIINEIIEGMKQEYVWDYTKKSIREYLDSKKIMRNIDIIIIDKKSKSLPRIFGRNVLQMDDIQPIKFFPSNQYTFNQDSYHYI